MRFLFLLFGLWAFAAANIFRHNKKSELSPLDEAKKMIEMTEAILKASDFAKEGHLSEASKKADEASQIAETMVELHAPGLKRKDADRLKASAQEAEKAAAANDKPVLEQAISFMEYHLEKILENMEDLIKKVEHGTESAENVVPSDIANVPVLEDPTAMADMEATVKQTVDNSTIPDKYKQQAADFTLKTAKEAFKGVELTNAKLVILSENEEKLIAEPPHHHFHLFGFGKHNKCDHSRSFNFSDCRHNFGFRFCRRVFFRRFFHHRGLHHFFNIQ